MINGLLETFRFNPFIQLTGQVGRHADISDVSMKINTIALFYK